MVMYRRVLELDPTSEAALRALSHAAPAQTAELLIDLADHLGATPRAALALLEAALRHGSDDPGYAALIERAKVADPESSLSFRLAEVAARQSGDGEALLAALRSRREAADDPIEQALDLVREALLVAETDLPLAERLIDEALRARPVIWRCASYRSAWCRPKPKSAPAGAKRRPKPAKGRPARACWQKPRSSARAAATRRPRRAMRTRPTSSCRASCGEWPPSATPRRARPRRVSPSRSWSRRGGRRSPKPNAAFTNA